ncbi:glycosyl hydrolase family 28 protein [Haloferula sp. BvORR071]|uniref:glycoside hydrolase family 28 protein n=1 Tax=Haloferula sp. BvORR071 TaxID=1396141 RepID=UPI0006978B63|nr:glycosyl hydrolase family 28 protein [Haloferula sp. BvORR071]
MMTRLLHAATLAALMSPGLLTAESAQLIREPQIPQREIRVVSVPSGLATAAIQKAMDAASDAGGGCVIIPEGRFLSGPLVLGSNTELHLAKGAVLLMSDREEDFPAGAKARPPFISARDAHDVRLSGEGTIDGQGERWWKVFRAEKAQGGKDAPRRPQLIALQGCERVEIAGITTLNPPNTHYSLRDCKELLIHGIKAIAPDDSPNTDALNLNGVRNVLIRDCNISTGDDNIVLLCSASKKPGVPEVENVTIRDCVLGFGHGLSIGSYTSGGVRNVSAENIRFDGTTSGIRMKASRDRGGVVENIRYRNLTMNKVRFPVSITSYYPKPPDHPSRDLSTEGARLNPVWRDISIENLTATDSKNSIIVWGLPDAPVRDLSLKHVRISAAAGALVFHGRGISFADVEIHPASGPALRHFDAEIQGLIGDELDEQSVKFQ